MFFLNFTSFPLFKIFCTYNRPTVMLNWIGGLCGLTVSLQLGIWLRSLLASFHQKRQYKPFIRYLFVQLSEVESCMVFITKYLPTKMNGLVMNTQGKKL